MRVGSLFSGIGGFDLGFERAGMTVAWQVEADKYCNMVLANHWPESERYDDVRQFARDTKPAAVELICGGFPCQDLSMAGKRAGLAGSRSSLWFEFARLIDDLRPRWVVIENVPGLLSSDDGKDMGVITAKLAELGYGWAYRVLDSQYFGVAQRRRRVFIVANLGSPTGAAKVLFESESGERDTPPSREAGQVSPPLTATGVGAGRTGNERNELDFAIPTYWDGGDLADTLDVSQLSKGQMMPDKRRFPAIMEPISFMVRGDGGDFQEGISPTMMSIHKTGDKQSGAHGLAAAIYQWASGGGDDLKDSAQTLRAGAENMYAYSGKQILANPKMFVIANEAPAN